MKGLNKRKMGAIDTLVGANSKICGDISFSGGLHVEGYIEGNIIAEADSESVVSVSERGYICGNVSVPAVLLSGTVNGDVTARQRLELGDTAKVEGNVYYDTMKMAIGAEVNGNLIHRPATEAVELVVVSDKAQEDDDIVEIKVK